MILAHDYFTVHYDCTHDMLRAVRVTSERQTYEEVDTDSRLICSPDLCRHCVARKERARERRIEKERGHVD